MNIKKELNDFHKQMEEDFYPLDPVLFYWFIPFLIISLLFIYQQKTNIMKKQQTAVEWLVEKMLNQDWYTYKSLEYIEQAKVIEEEQIMNAWVKGVVSEGDMTARQYYNETYEK
jgi:hypothetical protein